MPAASRNLLPKRHANAAAASRTARFDPAMCLEPSPKAWTGETGTGRGARGGAAGAGRRGAPGRDGREGSHGSDEDASVIEAATPPSTLDSTGITDGAANLGS